VSTIKQHISALITNASSVSCILLPAYVAYKALRSRDPAQSHPWLIYFTVLSLVQLADSYTLFITSWIPFFGVFRLFFMLYLVLPQTQGAKVLYLDYLEPYIVHHENQIDDFITKAHAQLNSIGFGYINVLIEFVREKVLHQQSPQPPPQQTGAGSYSSYANNLLSQFMMPQARPSADQPVGGIYSALSSFAGSALAAQAASRGMARGMPEQEAAGVPDSLLSQANNQDSAQRSKFISDQRERLTGILRQLESEQQSIDLAYGSGGMSKSRSTASFVDVGHDDFQPPPPVTGLSPSHPGSGSRQSSSGNWGQAAQAAAGWLGGDDKRKSGGGRESGGWSAARDITAAISSGFDRDNDSSDRRR
jgi:hypothetical protein